MNSISPPETDVIATAKNRVQNAPVPDWTEECTYDASYKPQIESPITYLLFDTQVHAERHEVFVHNVVRLETMEAVQHWSQWRLRFEPKNQLVTLHSLKVRRGDTETDQSNVGKAHLLQREEGLDRFVIHGWLTLLMVLEDVRPGDVLDFSYTIETQGGIFAEHGGYFFALPMGVPTGKYRFATHFNPSRQRKWKSSSADLKPMETVKDGLTFWEWSGENFVGQKLEGNTPGSHIPYSWIQVSDFPDWQTIAVRLSQEWEKGNVVEAVADMAREIEKQEPDLAARIGKAILFVQDECRYLSVNLELGGQIPSPPDTVARRRFGDCKDLSFLLSCLLKELGGAARPVLVNVSWRHSILDFLPMPSLFNHAVVEFEADGKKRWIDVTFKEQGGDVFNRVIPNYGLGLPIDRNATGLVPIPKIERSNLYDLHERVLLDTTNGPSLMAVTLRAEGGQADLLRLQLKRSGMEEMAKQRLQAAIGRFGNASRVGPIQYRDDRANNRFIITEVFEIKFFTGTHSNPQLCRVNLPAHWLARVLLMPEKKERLAPFMLPYPCQIQYVAEVECGGIPQKIKLEPRVELNSPFVQFNKTSKAAKGYFFMKCALSTHKEYVPAEEVQSHAEIIEKIVRACCRELSLLRNYSRPKPKPGFGELPPVVEKTLVNPSVPASEPPPPPIQTTHRRRHRIRRRFKIPSAIIWIIGFIIFYILLVTVLKSLSPS